MQRRSVLTAVASLVVVVPLAVSCGDDDDTSDTPDDTEAVEDDDTSDAPDDTDAAEDDDTDEVDAGDADDQESADDDGDLGDAGDDESAADIAGTDPGAIVDGSDVDWATIDLAAIDWTVVDMATVDFPALEQNPTLADLDADTIALIQERYATEVAAGGAGAGSGEAVLTIGDQTWEFDGFVCAVGYQNTESDVFSFSSNAFGTLEDGTRTQLQANIWDESGSNSLTGPDTDHEITFDDIDDFEDPQVNWLLAGDDVELSIDGVEVSTEGTFRDLGTGEEAPGSFVGECGPGSRL